MQGAISEQAASALAVTLKAIADPLRLRMLSAIASDPRGELCACDLGSLADVAQPTVSHHLKVMKDAGVLTSERRGTWVWYRVADAVRPAVSTLFDVFAPAAVHPAVHSTVHDSYRALADVDDALDRLVDELATTHPGLSPETVATIVRESYAGLARAARVTRHLLPLTQRFAKQRLADLSRDRSAAVPQVLFVCVANAGRSQLAASLVNRYADGRVVARSAGSTPAADVHPSVRPLLVEIDPSTADSAFPKPLTDDAVRAADVVITMGCGDVCPIIPGVRYDEWAVGDPALASPEGIAAIRADIDRRVQALLADLIPNR